MRTLLVALSCAIAAFTMAPDPIGGISERYVKLVLALGQHDADYVDAYYGPPEWKKAAEDTKLSLDAIAARAGALASQLSRERPAAGAARAGAAHAPNVVPEAEMQSLRLQYLQRQVSSMSARIRM